MFAIGRAQGAERAIEGIIDDYLDVIISYLAPKMQDEEE